MACHNHASAQLDTVSTQPLDQCTTCARKHIEDAFGFFHEFLYRDVNRALICWNLRAAAHNTQFCFHIRILNSFFCLWQHIQSQYTIPGTKREMMFAAARRGRT